MSKQVYFIISVAFIGAGIVLRVYRNYKQRKQHEEQLTLLDDATEIDRDGESRDKSRKTRFQTATSVFDAILPVPFSRFYKLLNGLKAHYDVVDKSNCDNLKEEINEDHFEIRESTNDDELKFLTNENQAIFPREVFEESSDENEPKNVDSNNLATAYSNEKESRLCNDDEKTSSSVTSVSSDTSSFGSSSQSTLTSELSTTSGEESDDNEDSMASTNFAYNQSVKENKLIRTTSDHKIRHNTIARLEVVKHNEERMEVTNKTDGAIHDLLTARTENGDLHQETEISNVLNQIIAEDVVMKPPKKDRAFQVNDKNSSVIAPNSDLKLFMASTQEDYNKHLSSMEVEMKINQLQLESFCVENLQGVRDDDVTSNTSRIRIQKKNDKNESEELLMLLSSPMSPILEEQEGAFDNDEQSMVSDNEENEVVCACRQAVISEDVHEQHPVVDDEAEKKTAYLYQPGCLTIAAIRQCSDEIEQINDANLSTYIPANTSQVLLPNGDNGKGFSTGTRHLAQVKRSSVANDEKNEENRPLHITADVHAQMDKYEQKITNGGTSNYENSCKLTSTFALASGTKTATSTHASANGNTDAPKRTNHNLQTDEQDNAKVTTGTVLHEDANERLEKNCQALTKASRLSERQELHKEQMGQCISCCKTDQSNVNIKNPVEVTAIGKAVPEKRNRPINKTTELQTTQFSSETATQFEQPKLRQLEAVPVTDDKLNIKYESALEYVDNSASTLDKTFSGASPIETSVSDKPDQAVTKQTVKENEATKSAYVHPVVQNAPESSKTVTVPKGILALYGSGLRPGIPTTCSLSVQMQVSQVGLSDEKSFSVVEDDNACDFKIFIKNMDGLNENNSKVYIKIILQNKQFGSKRTKMKTKGRKCSSHVEWNKQIVLKNIQRKFLITGCLYVAIWSKERTKSNKRICGVDLEMGKETEIVKDKGLEMTLSERLLSVRNQWVDAILYLS
ncbi:unnamed protein product [Clavelina lepadiformis]|uniref:C2 domain-containing protein n=1 Tax=Clavelina lepadiformis TaxID=159417 RepID=A0ABP0F148_CLALP